MADLDNVNYDELRRIYSERFNAAGDFDFVFTGNFNVDTLRSYVEQYIAPLKAAKKRESITDLNIRPAKGIINNRLYAPWKRQRPPSHASTWAKRLIL